MFILYVFFLVYCICVMVRFRRHIFLYLVSTI